MVALGPSQADGPGAGEDSGLGRGRVREKEVLRRARHRQREGESGASVFFDLERKRGVGKRGAFWSEVHLLSALLTFIRGRRPRKKNASYHCVGLSSRRDDQKALLCSFVLHQ